MNDLAITGLLMGSLFLILGSGVWIGLTLSGVAWIAIQIFSQRAAGDARFGRRRGGGRLGHQGRQRPGANHGGDAD